MTTVGLLTPRLSVNALTSPEDKRFRQLRQAIASHASLLKIPGLAAAVVKDGQVTFVQAEGFADLDRKIPMRRDHIFPVASLTKTFAAVTLMQYEQEGKLNLDDYILDYPFLSVGFTPERLQDPNVTIRHVLSHTSEGEAGTNYIYNGNRYNLVYGVFEQVSGDTRHYEAFAGEVTKRILKPLNLKDTFPGYPSDKNSPALPRIVTPYLWDRERQSFTSDRNLPGMTTLFPSSNLLTTLDDLAAYSNALDQHSLLTPESYQKLTSPFVTRGGRTNPYGLGWATQRVYDRPVHWHYGYGDSYASLIIRVPQDKLSFILLSNGGPASGAFLLGYGNLLSSVFAQAFFKHIVLGRSAQFSYTGLMDKPVVATDALAYDEIFSQALMRHHAEQNYHTNPGEATALLYYLAQHDPARFQKMDIALIHLLAELADPTLKTHMESAIKAYAATRYFHPDIHGLIAGWYERTGNGQTARDWYHQLADSQGYGENGAVKNACNVLGKYYLGQGEKEKGRAYLWRESLFTRYMTSGTEQASQQISTMKSR